jgi:hypothetical protein
MYVCAASVRSVDGVSRGSLVLVWFVQSGMSFVGLRYDPEIIVGDAFVVDGPSIVIASVCLCAL